MKDMVARLEKLRREAAECESIRDSADDGRKRQLFGKLAAHLKMLAGEVERAIVANYHSDTSWAARRKSLFRRRRPNRSSLLQPGIGNR
jgi:hypothetical protein